MVNKEVNFENLYIYMVFNKIIFTVSFYFPLKTRKRKTYILKFMFIYQFTNFTQKISRDLGLDNKWLRLQAKQTCFHTTKSTQIQSCNFFLDCVTLSHENHQFTSVGTLTGKVLELVYKFNIVQYSNLDCPILVPLRMPFLFHPFRTRL